MEREHFLTMFAHQLRSPLTALLSALQLLERRGLSKKRRDEMLALVKAEGTRLQKFTHQFLDMEGALAVSRSVQYETVSLLEVIEDLVRRFRVSNEGYDFVIQSPDPAPLVWADQQRIEHILSNLLDNAVIYSPNDTRVTVAVELLDEETVRVAVQDQGPGIPLAEQELVFERFYRAARSRQRRVYGHGLGLTIVREMVKEMGGTVWVESRENHGATFYFTLRRSR
jgi:two-component system phosphate regulon sensor histidine kinase PhoR